MGEDHSAIDSVNGPLMYPSIMAQNINYNGRTMTNIVKFLNNMLNDENNYLQFQTCMNFVCYSKSPKPIPEILTSDWRRQGSIVF